MIGLPEDLYLQCEAIVKSEKHGYASVSEIVKESVRRRLEELNEYFQKRKEKTS
jgi:Arc/MetJ-type ribon-helix-helix transcriptional regulator